MRRVVLFVIIVMFAGSVYANDLVDLQQEKGQLKQQIQKYQQAIQRLQVRIIQINAVSGYIEAKESEKEEVVDVEENQD